MSEEQEREQPDDRAGRHDWENLRRPFEDGEINILCRATKRTNDKGNCQDCGKWHGLPSVALGYVSHAHITERLNEADWSWCPLALDEQGLPAIVVGKKELFLWIELTIWDRTVIEVGAAPKDGKDEVMKHLVSDALRRAAMRFGIALDLWKKEKWEPDQDDAGTGAAQASPPPPPQGTPAAVQSIILRAEEEKSVSPDRYAQELTRGIRAISPDVNWRNWIMGEVTEYNGKKYTSLKPLSPSAAFRKWETLAQIDELIPGRGNVGAAANAWVAQQGDNCSEKAHQGVRSVFPDTSPPMGGPPDDGAPPPEDDDSIPF